MAYFLGVEGGGAKTICYLANDKGEIVGRGEAGLSFYHVGGLEKSIQEIGDAVSRSIASSGKEVLEIESACFGLAGIDSQIDHDRIYKALVGQGIARNIILENDSVIALMGGTTKDHGVVLIAGVGAISFGINKIGQRKRASGWGYIVGDEGSSYDIGITGIRAALKAYDGRGPKTAILPLLKKALGLNSMEELLDKVYYHLGRAEIAALGNLVFQAVLIGDEVAQRIIIKAGDELGQCIDAVITSLGLTQEEMEIPLVGEVFANEGAELLVDVIKEKVLSAAPKAKIIEPQFEPAVGAVMWALTHSQIELDVTVLTNLKRTRENF